MRAYLTYRTSLLQVAFPEHVTESVARTADGSDRELSVGLKWISAKGTSNLNCSLESGWWEARKGAGLNNKGDRAATLTPIEGNHRRLRLVTLRGEEAEAAMRSLEESCPEAVLDPGHVGSAAVRGGRGTEFAAAAGAAASVQAVAADMTSKGMHTSWAPCSLITLCGWM